MIKIGTDASFNEILEFTSRVVAEKFGCDLPLAPDSFAGVLAMRCAEIMNDAYVEFRRLAAIESFPA